MKRILNLGCGNDSYGTDRIDLFKTPTTTKVSDFNKKLPYPDNYFDEVYSKSVIEHIKNLDNFEKEIYRVLKKGGKLFIRTDFAGYLPTHIFKTHEHNNILAPQYKVNAFSHEQGEDAHYHLFVASHLKKLFRRFKNIRFSYFYGGKSSMRKFLLRLLPFNMGAIHLDMYAEKS
jgi:ubiquinone/menaquinone biosynthesis C-methylase UbiE